MIWAFVVFIKGGTINLGETIFFLVFFFIKKEKKSKSFVFGRVKKLILEVYSIKFWGAMYS
jgi:hypothetical protein